MIVPTLRNASLQINPGKDNRRGPEGEETFVTGVSNSLLATCLLILVLKNQASILQFILKLKANEH
jgi:hypothetical protein